MHRRHAAIIAAIGIGLFLAGSVGYVGQSQAGRVERAFRGTVVLLGKRAPMRFRSDGAFMRFLRKHRKKHIWPADKKETKWKLEFFAFFKRPANDVEVKIKFFDITEGKKFVAGDSLYLSNRNERILASNITLEKPRFRINRKYAMYITNARNVVLSSTVFWLRGRRAVYSGRVTFSDEEARLK